MILLDTNALIWLDRGHRRARLLLRERHRLYVSPLDRLIAAHAQLCRWRLATADEPIAEALGSSASLLL